MRYASRADSREQAADCAMRPSGKGGSLTFSVQQMHLMPAQVELGLYKIRVNAIAA